MDATNTMLLWNEKTGDVLLKKWPELNPGRHSGYRSALACYLNLQKADFAKRQTVVFIEAMHLIVRDGIDPQKLHNVLMGLDEYREACSNDMPKPKKV